MRIHPIETHKITLKDQNVFAILDTYVSAFDERTVLAITSKIVSICEGRVVKIGTVEKRTLIAQEADDFLPAALNKYHMTLMIKQGMLIPTAGIDESNGDGYYILWPRDPQQTANAVRAYLQRRFSRTHVGVIITDSKTTPLRVGVTGVALAYSGFQALNDYVGTKDLFGRALRMTKVNVVDALATAAGEDSVAKSFQLLERLLVLGIQALEVFLEFGRGRRKNFNVQPTLFGEEDREGAWCDL